MTQESQETPQPFDFKAFGRAQFLERTKELPISDDSGTAQIIKIRNLTANELAKANESLQSAKTLDKIISEGLTTSAELVARLKSALAIDDEIRPDLAYRQTIFSMGVVNEPPLSVQDAAKFAKHRPHDFYRITNEINELTSQGAELKKKR